MAIMAKRTVKTTQKPVKEKQKYFRIVMLFVGVIIVSAALGLFLWGFSKVLFSRNPHFILRRVEVFSSGWWNGKSKDIISMLNLKPDRDNLFSSELTLNNLRNNLEKIPSVESATISRILPDTLRIKIIERIPRAFLKSNRSRWVVDEHAIVMLRDYCLNLKLEMPIILGFDFNAPIKPGMELPEIQPALDLIMLTVRYFPNIKISAVSIRNPENLDFFMLYKGKKQYEVLIPRKRLNLMLKVLEEAIVKALGNDDQRAVINLTYDGNAVFR